MYKNSLFILNLIHPTNYPYTKTKALKTIDKKDPGY